MGPICPGGGGGSFFFFFFLTFTATLLPGSASLFWE